MATGGQPPGHTPCKLDENSRLQEKHSGQEGYGFEYIGIDNEYEPQNTELVNVLTGKMSNFEIVSCHSNTNIASLSCSQNDPTHNWEDCIDSQNGSIPKYLIVETLIRITKYNEESILACRGILLGRARLINGCRKERLINRRTTNKRS